MTANSDYPARIVCITEEPTEILYRLGEEKRIVGISNYTVRPARAKKEKPRVSAFISAKILKILELKPDLVIGYSDIQAAIAQELITKGITVFISNHRSVEDIFNYILFIGRLVSKEDMASNLIYDIKDKIAHRKNEINKRAYLPKVYFEEWDNPIITSIQWVGELIELAGGDYIYKSKMNESLAKNRIIENPDEVVRKNPDIILASWCGKKFKKDVLISRIKWDEIKAVKSGQVFEIDSSVILQPGLAAITEGFEMICNIIDNWYESKPDSDQ
jgi:iron complex transport system substrate-binding protein